MNKKIASMICLMSLLTVTGCKDKVILNDISQYTDNVTPFVYGTDSPTEGLEYNYIDIDGWDEYEIDDPVEKVGNLILPMGPEITLGQFAEIMEAQCVDMSANEFLDNDGCKIRTVASHTSENANFWMRDKNGYGFVVEAIIYNDTQDRIKAEDCHVYAINGMSPGVSHAEDPGLQKLKDDLYDDNICAYDKDELFEYLENAGFIYDGYDDYYAENRYRKEMFITGYDGEDVCVLYCMDLYDDEDDDSKCHLSFYQEVSYPNWW